MGTAARSSGRSAGETARTRANIRSSSEEVFRMIGRSVETDAFLTIAPDEMAGAPDEDDRDEELQPDVPPTLITAEELRHLHEENSALRMQVHGIMQMMMQQSQDAERRRIEEEKRKNDERTHQEWLQRQEKQQKEASAREAGENKEEKRM